MLMFSMGGASGWVGGGGYDVLERASCGGVVCPQPHSVACAQHDASACWMNAAVDCWLLRARHATLLLWVSPSLLVV